MITEGIIGVGKTTFSERLAHHLNAEWLREPDETNGNVYLKQFYQDPERWALTMQLHLLNMRFRMHQNAQWCTLNQNKHVVLDRSYFGDTAFARLQLNRKSMSQDEYNTYTMCYKNMSSVVMLPQVCVHLKAEPEVAQQRIQKRMEKQLGRKCENSIDLDYLKELYTEECTVINTLAKQGVHIIEVDWNESKKFEDIDNYAKILATEISNYQVPDLLLDCYRRSI